MAEKHDREKLIDVALDLCIRQGYEATTIDQIAAAVGVASHAVGRDFATKDAIVLSIVDDIVVAVATELARIPPQTSPPEALLAANTEALLAANTAVISDIANGGGVITRERMQALAYILTASMDLRKTAVCTRQAGAQRCARRAHGSRTRGFARAVSGHHSLGGHSRRLQLRPWRAGPPRPT